jgi:hypothetical protein
VSEAPRTYTFVLSEEEIWAYRRYAGRQIYRSLGSGYGYFGALFLSIFVIGLAVYAAYLLDLFDRDSLRPVLGTAYVAFFVGASIGSRTLHWQSRRLARAFYRLSAMDKEQWQYSFDDAGLLCRSQAVETRVAWQAMRSIDNNDAMVVLWADTAAGAYHVPARVFASAAERTAFVRWATDRIAAARRQAA